MTGPIFGPGGPASAAAPPSMSLTAEPVQHHNKACRRRGHIRAVVEWIRRAVVESLIAWHRRGHDRRFLAALDDRMLDDLGLDRSVVRSPPVPRELQLLTGRD